MEKQHLTYFKIENFKRFDSFEMSNLGQFNLIVGDNNVGKTSVLEGLLFDEDLPSMAYNYISSLYFRNMLQSDNDDLTDLEILTTNFWLLVIKDSSKPIILKFEGDINGEIEILLKSNINLYGKEIEIARNKITSYVPDSWIKLTNNRYGLDNFQLIDAYSTGTAKENDYVPYIPVNMGYRDDLVDFFYTYYNSDKKLRKELSENLQLFIPNLEEIRVHKFTPGNEALGLILVDSNETIPLTRFGDGTVKVTRILLEILISQGKRLMVDEIGAGIHFSRLKEYWSTIIQLCHKYNVQLFATTHSLECQRAFVEALDDEVMKQYQADARNITLIEDQQGEVKAITYDFEQFEYALDIGFNTRGGSL